MPCICASKSNRSVRSKANGSASKWGVRQQDIVGGNARTKFSHHTCAVLTLHWSAENANLDCCLHLLIARLPRRGRGMPLLALSPKGEGEEAATSKLAYACVQNTQPRWQLHGARSLLSNTCISRCRAPPLSPLSKVELDIGIA